MHSQIPPDDLLDVMEMTNKIEKYICRTLKGNQLDLAISALMSASVNSILSQCTDIEELKFYKCIFIKVFETSIQNIQKRRQ